MSVAKRCKRNRKRRQKKWRKRVNKSKIRYERELLHSEFLDQFQTFINEEYRRGEITLYRWSHNPYIEDDFKPQIFQSYSDRDISDVIIPSPMGSKVRIKKYVEYFTLSHFVSEQQAIDKYRALLSKLSSSNHPESVAEFKEHKGVYVQKCNYGENDALYGTPNAEGHVNVLLCNGFDPERVIDTTYAPIEIV